MEYSWHTDSSSQYFSWQDITDSNSVFYFDVPVSEYDCEVRIYAYLQYYDFRGYWQYMDSRNTYFQTDCLDPGNVSLVMDGVGEVWEDWSNLNNGTNDMMWELTDLNAGTEYALDWYVRVNDDFVLYEHQTWQATSDSGICPGPSRSTTRPPATSRSATGCGSTPRAPALRTGWT